MKKAIITGITGQDGAYLAELLLEKGYLVYGTFRRTSSTNFWRIEELGIQNHSNLKLVEYDLIDSSSAYRLIKDCDPDEVYNLAAQSFVGVSFTQSIATGQITGIGALNLLDTIKIINPNIKFYQASYYKDYKTNLLDKYLRFYDPAKNEKYLIDASVSSLHLMISPLRLKNLTQMQKSSC